MTFSVNTNDEKKYGSNMDGSLLGKHLKKNNQKSIPSKLEPKSIVTSKALSENLAPKVNTVHSSPISPNFFVNFFILKCL